MHVKLTQDHWYTPDGVNIVQGKRGDVVELDDELADRWIHEKEIAVAAKAVEVVEDPEEDSDDDEEKDAGESEENKDAGGSTGTKSRSRRR